MKTAKNVLIVVLILMVASLVVFSNIQRGYAEQEREKAIVAQYIADENAMKAEANAEEAAKSAALANMEKTKAVFLKQELEACKKKK